MLKVQGQEIKRQRRWRRPSSSNLLSLFYNSDNPLSPAVNNDKSIAITMI